MPFCGSCGAQMEGKFCAKCGAAIGAGAPDQSPPPSAGPGPGSYASPVAAPMQDNMASALCYVGWFITGIVFLVMEPYSKNRAIRFHAFQSIFMSVALIAVEMVLTIIVPFSFYGWLYYLLWRLFGLACFALWAFLIYSAYQGKTVLLPVIGPLAQKQAQA